MSQRERDLTEYAPQELLAWAEKQPWAASMAETAQDPKLHAEGDVWTHTKKVCHELTGLSEWTVHSAHDQAVLYLAALLHDVAKPTTTEERPDRIISPNHGPAGQRIAGKILINEPLSLADRMRILGMIRYHTTPPSITKRAKPERTVIDVSWRAPSDMLYLLAVADGLGRDSVERQAFLDRVEEYKKICHKMNCFEQPYPFANDLARFLWFRNSLKDPTAVYEEDYCCEVTMLAGLPGAGKDYWYKHNAAHLPMLSLDDIRKELGISWTDDQGPVIRGAEERFIGYLKDGTDFVYNATNINREMRRKWIRIARHRSARIKVVYIEPPLETIRKQNRQREAVVDEQVVEEYIEKIEVPDATEAHEVVWV